MIHRFFSTVVTIVIVTAINGEDEVGDENFIYKCELHSITQNADNNTDFTKNLSNTDKRKSSLWNISFENDRILEQLNHTRVDGNPRMNHIWLEWGPSFWGVKAGIEEFKDCRVKECTIMPRQEKDASVVADARVFTDGVNYLDLPRLKNFHRTSSQIWIVHVLESPVMGSSNFQLLETCFNWTATYRIDSTIVTPYARWVPFNDNVTHTSVQNSIKNYAENKTKKAAIFVSNCQTSNNRLEYVMELSRYIEVDIFGDCGRLQCLKSNTNDCYEMLRKNYKFYLAFENSNCRDYITEKFYVNALKNDVLPVVMGAHPEDYKRSAPRNSYIHVEDFKSPKDLAEYLHKLDKNDSLYNEYFRWKGTGSFIDTKFWCRLCAMLNDQNKPNLVVKELDRWWRSERTCIRADQRWT